MLCGRWRMYGRTGNSALAVLGSNFGNQPDPIYLASDEVGVDDRLTLMMAASLIFF